MRSTPRRAISILVALAILLGLAAAPASALTLQRTWSAKLGTSGANGTVVLRAYTSGIGSVRYTVKALRANATYSVAIRYGTCSRLGTVADRLPAIRTSATGTASVGFALSSVHMSYIWRAARSAGFVVRIANGTSIKCAPFSFAHATRVAISSLGIDLPIIRGPSGYPPCRVAMYLPAVAQPREPGITFIYAHARRGMFLPLLTRWRIDHGRSLLGKVVRVWTSNNSVSSYRINKVRVTSNAMSGVTTLSRERLWLQTSTGPNHTYPKLIVEAYRYQTLHTTYAASHPAAHPVSC